MAGKGSVNIKIGGDASAYQKELNESVKATEAAAAKIDGALSDAAKSLSDGLADSFKSAQKEQATAVKSIGNSVHKIVDQNNELISQKSEMGDIYDKLGEGAKAASVKVKAGLADIKAGIDMAAAAARKLGEIAATGVNYNATIESMKTSFEVMTGSAEKAAEVVDRLRKMGAETPFEMTDLTSTTQLLMQYGFTADDAIDKMSILGDIAQGNSEAMTSIAMGYAQMSSAGKVNLQDIKQMINGGFNPLQEISERTGESMASLYDRISKGKMTIDEITQSMVHSTSEGGKFFQSMEKQSKTLNGQLSTLKDNANQLLGTLTSGMSDGLRDELLPLANNMIGELQSAFESGGMDSLVTTATDMIPDLLGMMTGKIEDAISGVTRWLPQGASKIMAAFPAALKATGSVIPQMTSALFEIAGVVLGDLVSMLPELVPVITESLLNLAESAFTGTISALNSLGEGLEKAMKRVGLIAPTAGEAFAAIVENVDQQTIDDLKKTIDVDIETDITVDEYQDKIDTAVESVETALKNVPGLSEAEEEEIKQAIIDGSGLDVLQLAFDEMGVDSTKAVSAIESAQGNIDAVVEGLGLSDAAKAHVQELINNNASAAEIQSAIESFGIDEGTASAAATSITTEMDSLDAVLADLGLDKTTITELRKGLANNKKQVEVALRLLGMEESDIDTVLTSYDTIAGSLTAGIDGIYKSIVDMFTDGKQESSEDIENAKAKIQGIVTEAQENIDAWYAEAVANLETSGLDPETMARELVDINQTYEDLSASLQSATETAITQVEGMVGKSTSYCKEQVGYLQETFGMIKDITSEIDLLTSKDISEAEKSRKLTIAGVTNDAGTQLEAFLITYKEYTDKVRKAEDEYLAAVDNARNILDNGGTQEEYAEAEEKARAELESARQHASNYYQQYVDQILAGIMQADPDMGGIIRKAVSASAMGKLVQDIGMALTSAAASNYEGDTTISLADILEQFSLDEGGIANLAESMGITPEHLLNLMEGQLKGLNAEFSAQGASFIQATQDMITGMLQSKEIDLSGVAATLATAIDSGYLLEAINGVDYTNASVIWNNTLQEALSVTDTVLKETEEAAAGVVDSAENGAAGSATAGSSKGSDFGDGYVSGIKKWALNAYWAGYSLAEAADKGVADGQDSHSPSKKAEAKGTFYGEGYEIGLRNSMAKAALTARQLTGEIVTAANISQSVRLANMPNLQQEIVSANSQTVTPVYLDGQQIASIQGYNNSMQLAWQNTRAAKGVGSR